MAEQLPDELIQLAARAIKSVAMRRGLAVTSRISEVELDEAREVLRVLAETGRLLPPESDVTHNWIVGFKTPNGDPHWEEFPTEVNARWFASARRDWGCTEISIKRRIEALGPWVEVLTDSKDKDSTDE